VKLLWAYIRENGLQDPENRRKIICNDVLRILFNTDSTDMFKMNKLLSKHIWPLENGSTVGEWSAFDPFFYSSCFFIGFVLILCILKVEEMRSTTSNKVPTYLQYGLCSK
jgi:hypothetical protein